MQVGRRQPLRRYNIMNKTIDFQGGGGVHQDLLRYISISSCVGVDGVGGSCVVVELLCR